MEFSLKFDMGNAAFAKDLRDSEVAEILTRVASFAGQGQTEGTIADSNGNRIGDWSISGERAADDDGEPVAFWLVDPAGDEVERFPTGCDAREDLVDSFRTDAERAAEANNEEDEREGHRDPHDAVWSVKAEYADGTIVEERS